MIRVTISPRAEADLMDILDYLTAHAGIRVAEKYDHSIRAQLRDLQKFPGIGTPKPRLGKDV